ncbi:tetratricopeptide repeat protein [Candidatus Sumerlaeota bacterium]|nr:tetratricopeptide repeat protein [Candidatus Sumerlaeota bacterium]
MSIYPEKIIKEIIDQIDVRTILEAINYRTDTIQEIGDTVKSFCPIHKEQVFRTLIINKKDKTYRCSYSLCPGNKGGDLISLFALSYNLDYDQGVAKMVKELNMDIELPTTQEFIDKTVEVAENYLELGVLDESEKYFSKVVEIQPNNIEAQKGLLEIYNIQKKNDIIIKQLKIVVSLLMEIRQLDDALIYCSQLVDKVPESKEARHWMVECYLGQENLQAALGEYMNLADLYEADSDFENALETYRKIENLGLDIIDVYPHIINVLVASNRTEEAIQETLKRAENFHTAKEYEKTLDCYKYILELDENRNDIRREYIQLAIKLGLTEERIDECMKIIDDLLLQHALKEAVESLQTMLQATPDNLKIIGKIVEVYLQQGRHEEAITLQLRLALLYEQAERLEDALSTLQKITEYQADNLEALSHTASLLYKKGESGRAIDTYKNIIEIQEQKGNLLETSATYDKLIQIAPDEILYKEQQIEILIKANETEKAFTKAEEMIDYLEAKKNYELVIEKIRFALNLKPEGDALIIRLADLLTRLKRLTEARDEYYHAYEVYRNTGRLDQATSQLMRCLDINPNDQKAIFALAETFSEIGDFRKALFHFKKLSSLLLDEGNLEEAEKVLQKIITLQPDDINTLILLVNIYQQLGYENEVVKTNERLSQLYIEKEAYNKVIEVCQDILSIRPENISAHEKLIFVYEKTNKRKEAIQHWFNLADIYDNLNDFTKEEECFKAILKIDNANIEARRLYIFLLLKNDQKQSAYKEARVLSDQYVMRRQADQAIELYNQLIKSDPDELSINLHLLDLYKKSAQTPQIIGQTLRLIEIYAQQEQISAVAEYYRQLLQYEPENVEFHNALIDTYLTLNQKDEAKTQCFALAELFLKKEDMDNAEQAYERVLTLNAEDQETFRKLIALNRKRENFSKAIELINHIADLQHKQGDAQQAIDTLREIFEIDAMNIENYRKIINIHREQEQIDKAIEMYLSLYDIFLNTGMMDDGIKTLKEAIDLKPDETQLRKKLVSAYITQDNIEESVKESFRICDIYVKSELYQEVLNTLAEILEHDPSNIQAKKRRAETYALMGDEKKALMEFMKISSDLDKIFTSPTPSGAGASPEAEYAIPELPIVEDYTFDSFVVGTRNNFAYATAMAVAKAPAQNYNPLFLCSDVGLGKTHLIHAIANYIKKHYPEMKILYTNSEEFTTQLIDAIQNNTILQFRARHKNTNLLLLDDVQFLAGKERAQEEFFHLFNTLFQAKKQIVITSDRPPKDIAHLEKRLKSRFAAGIIVDIQPPDMLTRAAILKRERDHLADVEVNDHLINLIAEKVDTNIRDLKGAFNQIIARQRITNQPITEEMVVQILDSLFEKV